MREAEDSETKSGTKNARDSFTLVLIIFLILMFLILVTFISLAFVYYYKITEEVSHLTIKDAEALKKEMNELRNIVKECTSQFENKLEQHKNETKLSCEIGWLEFDGHCYFFSDFQLNWKRAVTMCLNRESHLVIITSEAEQSFLLQHLNQRIYWIGMTDTEREGEFRWVDGTVLSSNKFWQEGEPNDYGSNEDCAVLFDADKWNDFECDSRQYAICEKRLI